MSTSDSALSDSKQTVRTRRVHYLSGFDPRGVRHYHQLYAEEAPRQAQLLGVTLDVDKRKQVAPHVFNWAVRGEWGGGQSVVTDYQFMAWDDLVRRYWDNGWPALVGGSIRYYVSGLWQGAFWRMGKMAQGALFTALFPLAYLLVLVWPVMLIFLLGLLGTFALGGGKALAVAAGAGLAIVVGWCGVRLMEALSVLWVLRTCLFLYQWGRRPFPEVDERIDEMVAHIRQAQAAEPVDEVLIVGHSVGTLLAVTVAARLVQQAGAGQDLGRFHLLTLGECIPYVSVVASAEAIRRDLAILGNDERMAWTDATALADPLCFFQVDPIRAAGLTPRFKNRPQKIVVRVFRMFKPETYARLRRNKARLHFQYLMASELPADYDYFKITAGPRRLREHST